LGSRIFDMAIIDEAGQGIEPAAWIAVLRAGKLVMAGDHCQLPPTVIAEEAQRQGLGVSVLERLMALWDGRMSHRLAVQYRMHEQIMAFSSRQFYDGSQVADAAVRHHLLVDLPHVAHTPLTETAVTFIDTAGAGYDEEDEEEGTSKLNREEARLAVELVGELLQAGVAAAEIALISPYSAQVRLLRELLTREEETLVEVNSVDGFQGREKEVIIVSLVRANSAGQIGFLADTRRMNVALTRARRKLIVIGDSATITAHPFYNELVGYFEEIEAYHSVWEWVHPQLN
jgi:ATP-dependent RNA/DNA helicase IGHMBP2